MALLTCKLGQQVLPLSCAELNRLETAMLALSERAADDEVTDEALSRAGLPASFRTRILALLDREEALRRYLGVAAGLAVLTRISDGFPRRLRRLRESCPPVLFCRGDCSLLSTPCIALVGSRRLGQRGRAFAERVGRLAAREGLTLVSGGAAGADTAAQEACLRAGGRVVCFVPDELLRHPARQNVLYCSEEGYEMPFTTPRALHRNHLIHALGEKAFVAQCPQCSGGTWAGASDNLRRGLSEVYVLRDGAEGTDALLAMGATPVDDFLPSLRALTPAQLSIFN